MKVIPTGVVLRCFLRSLVLQASWNVRGMQSVGFAYAIQPALSHLYDDPAQRGVAIRRHLEVFNTQPYMAEAILGGAIHHEVRIAAGLEPPERVEQFKQALAGPLAALGDSFFWASLRPASAALGAALAPLIGVWALLVFLVAYNAVHISSRVYLFVSGLRMGDGVLEAVGRLRLTERGVALKRMAAAGAGLALVSFTASQAPRVGYPGLLLPVIAVGVAGVLVPLRRRLTRPYLLLGAMVGVGLLAGLAGISG